MPRIGALAGRSTGQRPRPQPPNPRRAGRPAPSAARTARGRRRQAGRGGGVRCGAVRSLDHAELERLGAVLERHREAHTWPVAAIRLLTLTSARLSEILNLRWDEIGELSEDGTSACLEDSKTGPRTAWLGPEAARLLAALPRSEAARRVFPEDLTPHRLYVFWIGIREEAGLPGLRIHDCRHTWASQGVMSGVGLTTVGRLFGHRQRCTSAIHAHLDDAALQDAARLGRVRHPQTEPAQDRRTRHREGRPDRGIRALTAGAMCPRKPETVQPPTPIPETVAPRPQRRRTASLARAKSTDKNSRSRISQARALHASAYHLISGLPTTTQPYSSKNGRTCSHLSVMIAFRGI